MATLTKKYENFYILGGWNTSCVSSKGTRSVFQSFLNTMMILLLSSVIFLSVRLYVETKILNYSNNIINRKVCENVHTYVCYVWMFITFSNKPFKT